MKSWNLTVHFYNWLYNAMCTGCGGGGMLVRLFKWTLPTRWESNIAEPIWSYTWNDHESQKKFLAEKQGGLLGGRERERHIGKDLRLSAISNWAPGRNKKYIVRAETRIVMFPSIQLELLWCGAYLSGELREEATRDSYNTEWII
jgi:hypothetical protein